MSGRGADGERAGSEGMARLRTAGRKSAQFRSGFRSGFGRGLRCALVLSGNKNVQYTRKSAQFRNGFWRCLRRALVASGCANERTTRKSAYFVRPCAVAKQYRYCVKMRAKNAKNGRVKIAVSVCLWAKMSPTQGFGRWWYGGVAWLGCLALCLWP